jgi:hypothetical protein
LPEGHAPTELYSILESFKGVLKSTDVRTVAIKKPNDEQWQNLITSITMRNKTVEKILKEQAHLPKINNDAIGFFLCI